MAPVGFGGVSVERVERDSGCPDSLPQPGTPIGGPGGPLSLQLDAYCPPTHTVLMPARRAFLIAAGVVLLATLVGLGLYAGVDVYELTTTPFSVVPPAACPPSASPGTPDKTDSTFLGALLEHDSCWCVVLQDRFPLRPCNLPLISCLLSLSPPSRDLPVLNDSTNFTASICAPSRPSTGAPAYLVLQRTSAFTDSGDPPESEYPLLHDYAVAHGPDSHYVWWQHARRVGAVAEESKYVAPGVWEYDLKGAGDGYDVVRSGQLALKIVWSYT